MEPASLRFPPGDEHLLPAGSRGTREGARRARRRASNSLAGEGGGSTCIAASRTGRASRCSPEPREAQAPPQGLEIAPCLPGRAKRVGWPRGLLLAKQNSPAGEVNHGDGMHRGGRRLAKQFRQKPAKRGRAGQPTAARAAREEGQKSGITSEKREKKIIHKIKRPLIRGEERGVWEQRTDAGSA